MSGGFDPYYLWLSIPPKHQPPNHYRLLAIELFEDNPEVVADAAARQMAHVRTYGLGQHLEDSQRILNELAAAKACLLDPPQRAAYDQALRQRMENAAPPLPPPRPVPIAIPPPQVVPAAGTSIPEVWRPGPADVVPRRPRTTDGDRQSSMVIGGSIAAVGLSIVVGYALIRYSIPGRSPGTPVAPTAARGPQSQTALGINSVGMRFILVGKDDWERVSSSIGRSFYVATTEVTQSQYLTVMGNNPSYFCMTGPGGKQVQDHDTSRFPVENVTWFDAARFCNALSRKETLRPYFEINGNMVVEIGSDGYRLPTTQERLLLEAAYKGSNLDPFAWHRGNSADRTHSVAGRAPDPFGLYDLFGNVWEYESEPGAFSGIVFHASLDEPAYERRHVNTPDYSSNDIGFRLVRSMEDN